jgi:Ser/Thr protein kinase RdoA (MazF antagonist)
MSNPRRPILPVLAASSALVVLLAVRPLSTARALAIWVVLVAAIALLLLVRHSRDSRGGGARFEAALRRPQSSAPEPVELLRMERDLELGIAGAAHAHRRLLPILREAAAARLGARHGIELERRPDAARELLGEDVWDLLRPDRPEPADRFGPGIARARVAAAIERVESL